MSIPSLQFTCSKSYDDFPCSHRQWRHNGHCKFVHGYSRSFTFWFTAKGLDLNGFVFDFSNLKPLEMRLKKQFDHTFLINKDDPLINYWEKKPITVVLITHNLKEALLLGDRILFFSKRPATVVYDHKVKTKRNKLTLDGKKLQEEYLYLKKKFPSLLEGLI